MTLPAFILSLNSRTEKKRNENGIGGHDERRPAGGDGFQSHEEKNIVGENTRHPEENGRQQLIFFEKWEGRFPFTSQQNQKKRSDNKSQK